ncbi:MAG: ABC transporter permease [Nocardioides sp.]|uniref:ABC transporter permease n=1 Tax=Nocardioides nematodiphilus TaxID=2849669 RepID=UPI001CDA4611|nr:ABC transporter permease subunit [Nocardioides nematodiphilus]MCA1983606.1 ABC transporter permease subunit [Nocardioides nematodiphilus]
MRWFLDNWTDIRGLAWRHLWLSIVPVVLGFVLAVPIGYVAHRWRLGGSALVSIASVVYTIPSLPLLVILPSLLGTTFLDPTNVIVVLTIYAVAVMVRSAADGFGSVSEAVVDAARASGYSAWQRAVQVELPLAGPVLLAGVRVVSVSTVSLATISPLIGVSNLGSLFTDGFQRSFATEIVIGIVCVVVLALLLDLLWVLLGRVAMPWLSVRGAR